MLANIQEG